MERGVKKSGYVSLCRRSDNRSILAMTCGKLLPDALQKVQDEINYNGLDNDTQRKAKQLFGNIRIKYA